MTRRVRITRGELLYGISNLAYVIADVEEGRVEPHTLHQTFDICEKGNIDRVDSLLTLAAAEIGVAISPSGRISRRKGYWDLSFLDMSDARLMRAVELCREYMVAYVMWGWLSVTLPGAAGYWKTRRDETLDLLSRTVCGHSAAFSRRVPPLG